MIHTTIAQYRIESRLGEGRFTETYHAFDLIRRRPVALKLLITGLLPSEKATRDFLAQTQRAADLVHPRIAWVWETGEAEGRLLFAERYISGETLAAHISRSGPLPWDRSLQVIEQIAQAIEFAEEHGWTHGSITPHNILLGADLGAVLSDYGLANAIRAALPDLTPSTYDAAYLPPEALIGYPVTPRSDQYMLAAALVEMLTGKPMFSTAGLPDDRIVEEILAIKTETASRQPFPLEIIPPNVGQVIERALSAEPSSRFDNALDFVQALERALKFGQTDAVSRLQYEEQLRRRRETEADAQQQAEEIDRLAALELARHEIHERARLEAEQAIQFQDELPVAPAPERTPHSAPARRRSPRQPALRRLWPLLAGVILIAAALAGYWWNRQSSISGQFQPSPTPTHLDISSTQPISAPPHATIVSSPTSSPGATSTATLRPSPSPSKTVAPTHTRSATPMSTATPTQTVSPAPLQTTTEE